MPTAGKALFSWRVLVVDDYEERRHLPRNSRRLPGSRSQIFIERGEPTFGRAGPSFFAIFLLLHAAHTAVSHSAVRRECPLPGLMPTAGKSPYFSGLWSRTIAEEGSILSILSPPSGCQKEGYPPS
ncbi:hypothetical protein HMPREF0262_01114 [Clostridium sp. ATCC 29733]|nr:hypothetical protein HMPREF0262_01114 [Clostridium sp. ATCC 29733]